MYDGGSDDTADELAVFADAAAACFGAFGSLADVAAFCCGAASLADSFLPASGISMSTSGVSLAEKALFGWYSWSQMKKLFRCTWMISPLRSFDSAGSPAIETYF